MRFPKILFSISIVIALLSCNSSKINRKDLLEENQSLKEKLLSLQKIDTSIIEPVLELGNMNVVYRGVHNPVKISVLNAVSIEASAPGLKKIDNFGNYIMSPGSGLKVDVYIKAVLITGDTIQKTKTLRIKDINRPVGTINNLGCGSKCIIELKRDELKDGIIGVKLEDFVFDMGFKVRGFKIKFPNKPSITVEGIELNYKSKQLVYELEVGDVIHVFDIGWLIPNSGYKLKMPAPIKIKIVE